MEIPKTVHELARLIDYTELREGTTYEHIRQIAREAVDYGCVSCCVRPQHLPWIVDILSGSETKACIVVGFEHLRTKLLTNKRPTEEELRKYDVPLEQKKQEVTDAFDLIARESKQVKLEVDFVINILHLLHGEEESVRAEIEELTRFIKNKDSETMVKMIGENYWLAAEQKKKVYGWAREAGVDFVKTCTGFTARGAMMDDVRLMREIVGRDIGVKAAGGVNQLNWFGFVRAGANRIGTSSGKEILDGFEQDLSINERRS